VRAVAVRGTNFRCYSRLELELDAGVVAAVGPNGAGKTALVEMIHFSALGYSPRTSADPQLVTLGADFLRTELDADVAAGRTSVEIGYRPGEPKRVVVDGAAERSVERLLGRFPVLVFTPDRLRVVQGPPALRRSYLDRVLARLWPRLAEASHEYSRRLSQRNHLLKRVRAGVAAEDGLDAWDTVLAEAGASLVAARARLCSRLAGPLERRLSELGGTPGAPAIRYLPNAEGDAAELGRVLAARRRRDIDRAATGAGPHLDDLALIDADRDLRHYGSQGEQRRALLALILAEADLLGEERSEEPLLLLDDVTSELDQQRRERLLEAVASFQQTVVTTADEADLGGRAQTVLRVAGGQVTR
jgi:DNA replication and repair protein RecF